MGLNDLLDPDRLAVDVDTPFASRGRRVRVLPASRKTRRKPRRARAIKPQDGGTTPRLEDPRPRKPHQGLSGGAALC
jgi:hypothetical protein